MEKENIEQAHDKFCTFIHKKKRNIDIDIVYDIDKINTQAKFNLPELQNGKFILHINPIMFKYVELHQEAILFHEFTHLYDFFDAQVMFSGKVDNILLFLNSYSEVRASTIEMEVLLKLQNRGQYYLNNKDDKIPYLYSEMQLTEFISEKFAFAISSITTSNFKPKIHPVIPLCYYFGYMKSFSNGKVLVNNQLSKINTPLKKDIIKFSNACWNNKIDQILSLFDLLEKEYIKTYVAVESTKEMVSNLTQPQ